MVVKTDYELWSYLCSNESPVLFDHVLSKRAESFIRASNNERISEYACSTSQTRYCSCYLMQQATAK